jgi:hypothetical protein
MEVDWNWKIAPATAANHFNIRQRFQLNNLHLDHCKGFSFQ